jgi:hypothetical protein
VQQRLHGRAEGIGRLDQVGGEAEAVHGGRPGHRDVGSATPPFGCDIFTAVAVFKRPYLEVIRGTPPFVFMLLMVSVLLIFFPQIALFLRDVAFAK